MITDLLQVIQTYYVTSDCVLRVEEFTDNINNDSNNCERSALYFIEKAFHSFKTIVKTVFG